jgi:hypothetical protein
LAHKSAKPMYHGFEHESHQLDKVNFFHPRVRTRSARAHQTNCSLTDMAEELSYNLQEDDASNKQGYLVKLCKPLHVTAIQETACDELQWHIARVPKTSSKACFAQQVVSKKKCTLKIVQDN